MQLSNGAASPDGVRARLNRAGGRRGTTAASLPQRTVFREVDESEEATDSDESLRGRDEIPEEFQPTQWLGVRQPRKTPVSSLLLFRAPVKIPPP
jgi:hypothetical protein